MQVTTSSRESVNTLKLAKRLRRQVGRAIEEYNMIEAGDRVMVCLSGGKDSHVLLDILLRLQKSAPIRFALTAVNLDQKQPGFPAEVLPDYLEREGIPHEIIEQDTYTTVTRVIPEEKSYCSLCSRLRRGIFYTYAQKRGYTKIALGHHLDDIIETLFLNLFHGGSLKAMPPKLLADDGRNVVIRPLAYCREADIEAYALLRRFPIIPCDLCGSQDHLQRVKIKRMLQQWERAFPGRVNSIARAMQHIAPSQLMDRDLFDFANLAATHSPRDDWLVANRKEHS